MLPAVENLRLDESESEDSRDTLSVVVHAITIYHDGMLLTDVSFRLNAKLVYSVEA